MSYLDKKKVELEEQRRLMQLENIRVRDDRLTALNYKHSQEKSSKLPELKARSLGTFKPKSTGLVRPPKAVVEGTENTKLCFDCGRHFEANFFQRHLQICEKVFRGKRDVFDSAKYRTQKKYAR